MGRKDFRSTLFQGPSNDPCPSDSCLPHETHVFRYFWFWPIKWAPNGKVGCVRFQAEAPRWSVTSRPSSLSGVASQHGMPVFPWAMLLWLWLKEIQRETTQLVLFGIEKCNEFEPYHVYSSYKYYVCLSCPYDWYLLAQPRTSKVVLVSQVARN